MKIVATLLKRVVLAKNESYMREELIREYMPFILSCASKQSGRYIKLGQDEEATIAMMAFDEAIRSFDVEKGGFLSHAKRIIGRRLIDYYRKSKFTHHETLVDFEDRRNIETRENETRLAEYAYGAMKEEDERAWEIDAFKAELKAWGISFNDLVKNSPRHERLRSEYKELAKWIALSDDLMEELMRTHRLPIRKIVEKKEIPRKKLERGRIYIMSLIVVLTGDYRYIREYIDWR